MNPGKIIEEDGGETKPKEKSQKGPARLYKDQRAMYKKRDELKKQLEDRKLQEECTFKPTLMTKKPEKASSQVIETIPEVDEKDKKNSRFKDLFNLDLPPVDEKVQNQSKKNTPDFDQRSLSFGNK